MRNNNIINENWTWPSDFLFFFRQFFFSFLTNKLLFSEGVGMSNDRTTKVEIDHFIESLINHIVKSLIKSLRRKWISSSTITSSKIASSKKWLKITLLKVETILSKVLPRSKKKVVITLWKVTSYGILALKKIRKLSNLT